VLSECVRWLAQFPGDGPAVRVAGCEEYAVRVCENCNRTVSLAWRELVFKEEIPIDAKGGGIHVTRQAVYCGEECLLAHAERRVEPDLLAVIEEVLASMENWYDRIKDKPELEKQFHISVVHLWKTKLAKAEEEVHKRIRRAHGSERDGKRDERVKNVARTLEGVMQEFKTVKEHRGEDPAGLITVPEGLLERCIRDLGGTKREED